MIAGRSSSSAVIRRPARPNSNCTSRKTRLDPTGRVQHRRSHLKNTNMKTQALLSIAMAVWAALVSMTYHTESEQDFHWFISPVHAVVNRFPLYVNNSSGTCREPCEKSRSIPLRWQSCLFLLRRVRSIPRLWKGEETRCSAPLC